MNQEQQPEALRLAEFFESMKKSSHRWYDGTPVHEKAASELRRLHARVQELEASQAQRVPLNKTHAYEEHKKYPGACRHCGYAEHEPLQHGITREKQG